MGECLQTGKPCQYITDARVNSAFHPLKVGKSSTSLSGIKAGCKRQITLCDPIWHVTLRNSAMGFPYTQFLTFFYKTYLCFSGAGRSNKHKSMTYNGGLVQLNALVNET